MRKSNIYNVVVGNEGFWDKVSNFISKAYNIINPRAMRNKYDKLLADLEKGKITEDEVKKFVKDNEEKQLIH